jgi:hypothetical protein
MIARRLAAAGRGVEHFNEETGSGRPVRSNSSILKLQARHFFNYASDNLDFFV